MQGCLGSQATPGILRIALMAEDLRLLVSCLLYWASTTNSAWQSHGLRPKLGPKSPSKFLNVLLRFVAFCISFYVSIVSILLVFHIFVADSHYVLFIFRFWTHSLDTFSCLKRFRDRDPGSKPFFWTAVLLGLMIYIVAIYLTQIVLVYRVEGDIGVSLSLEPYFGSVPQQGVPACVSYCVSMRHVHTLLRWNCFTWESLGCTSWCSKQTALDINGLGNHVWWRPEV